MVDLEGECVKKKIASLACLTVNADFINNIISVSSAHTWSPILVIHLHYSDVIMSAMASPITGVTIVCSGGCSGADQRKHQSSASLVFVWVIHGWPVNSPHKWPVAWKMFPFDELIMVWKYRRPSANTWLITNIKNIFQMTRRLSSKWTRYHQLWRYTARYLIEADWHIHVSVNKVIIGSDNSLPPRRHQPIIWTDLLLIESRGTKFNEISIEIQAFALRPPFHRRHFQMHFLIVLYFHSNFTEVYS